MPRDNRAHPFATSPSPGETVEVAPGVLWLRFPLPFALDHVNVYLVEDGAGWALVDTGIGNEPTRETWRALLAGPLRGRPLTRLIVTHHHPDHMGLAGWLSERFDLPVYMSETEYLTGRFFMSGQDAVHGDVYHRFYRKHGMSQASADTVVARGHRYLELITGLPPFFYGLDEREPLTIGGRTFEVLKGGGHSPDQAMLFCRDEGLLLAADQVLGRISPNISVHALQPGADPLGVYLDSLARLRTRVPDGTLTLPGHDLPLTRLHERIDELLRHHEERCTVILEICRETPRSVAEITPQLFRRSLDDHQMSFAFSEALAHVNRLLREGRLARAEEAPVERFRAA